jgi:hypothetical protein
LDLVGPAPDDGDHAEEILPTAPSKWYLTGFLSPVEVSPGKERQGGLFEDMDVHPKGQRGDDDTVPEKAAARKAFFPSSMGVSVLVPDKVDHLDVTFAWGDYEPVPRHKDDPDTPPLPGLPEVHGPASRQWRRIPHEAKLKVQVKSGETALPGGNGLQVVLSVRDLHANGSVPAHTKAVSVFVVNRRKPAPDVKKDVAYVFQANLTVACPSPLVPRPDVHGRGGDDLDEQVADLQYREDMEFAVGHNVAATAVQEPDGRCLRVGTTWIPSAEVEKVIPTRVDGVELGMEALAAASSADALRRLIGQIVPQYEKWIAQQEAGLHLDADRAQVAKGLLGRARDAAKRMAAGLDLLSDPVVLDAFRIANSAMATAARQRACHGKTDAPASVPAPKWYPFQLAFLLMNLVGIAKPENKDRATVDLLFFPTGGGKTEAYLGLAAFTLVMRRLRNPGVASAGMSVLMRYTLRLLTLDQLGRAATLICALEILRRADQEKLGNWPFEIGLWVGMSATPNRMGTSKDRDDKTARARTIAYQNDDKRKPAPVPLDTCPWCGEKFTRNSFELRPNNSEPTELRIRCASRRCHFNGDPWLPIVAVDEPLYRRLPCFVIATVDKFASLPWEGKTGTLFGKVDRYDADGFYGPCDPGEGRSLPGQLLPPDLVIQDELHLISGPLGTMVGLYETAIDALSVRTVDGREVRPKIVASTATVRRASRQIKALFARDAVDVFPPPGPDRRDTFFSRTVPTTEQNARLYVGVAAQGRSLKVALLRAYLALMGAAQKRWHSAGGARNTANPADPYMTLLGYFNSLRELGGSRRIVEDEVKSKLESIDRDRRRLSDTAGLFGDRKIVFDVMELTSRVTTNKVADAKRRLALRFHDKERVDVALATNMISVGLDITRLGLMVVLGQPKTAAEYIQATSRVGRDAERPGLVVTLMNVHRPRDRSHYERFEAWHRTFYRAVEATSVTPFSPRATDRGLPALTVALARHGHPGMTFPTRAADITTLRKELNFVADTVAKRAEAHDSTLPAGDMEALRQKLKGQVNNLLDTWESIAHDKQKHGAGLQYQREKGEVPGLLHEPMDPELEKLPLPARRFKAGRSLRDVEPVVNLWVRNPDNMAVEGDDE